MACKIAGTSVGGFGFMGGAFGGIPGMAGQSSFIMNNIANNPLTSTVSSVAAAATAAVGDTVADPLTAISSEAAGLVSNVGIANDLAATLTGGALPGSSLVSNPFDLAASMTAHASEFIPGDISAGIQIFDQAQSFSLASLDIMPTITRMLGTDFGGITNIAKDFTDGGFLGESINNFDELLTNGLGNLADTGSFAELAGGFGNLGKFGNVSDFANIMQPGQVMGQMLDSGLGDVGNLANQLIENGIPLDDLTNPIYQNKIQGIMNGVTDLTDLRDIQSVMGSSLNLNSLGNLTDINRVIDGNIGKSFSSFADLGTKLQYIDTGNVASLGDLGDMMSSMTAGDDILQLIDQDAVLRQDFYDNIAGIYGSGTGPDGSVLLRDIMGTVGGYGIEEYIPTYDQAYGLLNGEGVTTTLQSMYGELSSALGGSYTDVSGAILTDPRTGTIYDNLDELVIEKTRQISGEFDNIGNNPSNTVQELLTTARANWGAASTQLNTELSNISISDIDTSLVTPGNKGSIIGFAQQLTTYGQDINNRAEYLERVAANTLTGGFMKFGLREGRNIAQLTENDIGYSGLIQDELEAILPFDTTL